MWLVTLPRLLLLLLLFPLLPLLALVEFARPLALPLSEADVDSCFLFEATPPSVRILNVFPVVARWCSCPCGKLEVRRAGSADEGDVGGDKEEEREEERRGADRTLGRMSLLLFTLLHSTGMPVPLRSFSLGDTASAVSLLRRARAPLADTLRGAP